MKVLYIIIFFALLFIFVYKGEENRNKKDSLNIKYIPKIIHHIAPSDKSKWKKDWQTHYDTWKTHYPAPEYTHYLWDEHSIDTIVETKYISIYPLFKSYKTDAQRAFIAKYIILYYYGGIYADMDVSCGSNKIDNMNDTKLIFQYDNMRENNLSTNVIASPQYHDFWKLVIYFANKTNVHVDNLHKSIGRELIHMCYMAYYDKHKIDFFNFK